MRSPESRRPNPSASIVASVYLLASCVWIASTDRLLRYISSDPDFMTRANIGKGFLFVFVTTGILYVLVRRLNRARRELEKTVVARTDALIESEEQ
ncbi:MAG: hypothetical protein WB817_07695, partial [Terriglobales bacterium]